MLEVELCFELPGKMKLRSVWKIGVCSLQQALRLVFIV